MIHNASRLTHAHPISLIACGIYCCVACHLLAGDALPDAISAGIARSNLMSLGEDDIKSDGYVLHTLEAALGTPFAPHTAGILQQFREAQDPHKRREIL